MQDKTDQEDESNSRTELFENSRRQVLKAAGAAGSGSLAFVGGAAAGEEGELVKDGIDTFVSDNSETPDWYTIGEDDELLHKPKGVRRTQQGLCFGGELKVSGYKVALQLCHYGGCNGEFEACLVACYSLGFEECDGYHELSVGDSTSPLRGSLRIYPHGELIGGAVIMTGGTIEGELCRYDPIEGQVCYTAETTINTDIT